MKIRGMGPSKPMSATSVCINRVTVLVEKWPISVLTAKSVTWNN